MFGRRKDEEIIKTYHPDPVMGMRKVNSKTVRITVISVGFVVCCSLLVDKPCPLSIKLSRTWYWIITNRR